MTASGNFRYIKNLKLAMSSVTIYRSILEDDVIFGFNHLIDSLIYEPKDFFKIIDAYGKFVFCFVKTRSQVNMSFPDFMKEKILYDDNPFSRLCEDSDYNSIPSGLKAAVSSDLYNLQMIANADSDIIKNYLLELCEDNEFEKNAVSCLPSWSTSDKNSFYEMSGLFGSAKSWSELGENLHNFYNRNGSGIFAKFNAFIWERSGSKGYLNGISSPDPVSLSDLIGYDTERAEVISNTRQFINGFHANNVLLYGDRGTGKSSTVKAIMNEYCSQGLRLIEVPKMYLADFHEIIRILKGRKQKFIIFVDDLVFEDNEENYTTLKAVLEGGIEAKPDNVVIYATSNRRHLIKEKFSDRLGLQSGNADDEIRAADTLQEKLSLSDRFGITVVFSSPDKRKYLEIVEGLAAKRGLKYDKEQLDKEALKWELWYNGRSPRTARQFVDWLEGQDNGN